MKESGEVQFRTLDEFPPGEIAAALERGYEGYMVPVRFSTEAYVNRIRRDHVDPARSYLIQGAHGTAQGVVLVARRGRSSRIAALGVVPEARRSGIGRRAMARATQDARERGDRRLVLEVITDNHAARRLYENSGFTTVRTLVGYELAPDAQAAPGDGPAPGGHAASGVPAAPGRHAMSGDPVAPVEECDLQQVLPLLLSAYPGDTSWQTDPVSFAGAVAPTRAFASDGAVALVEHAGTRAYLLALAVEPARRRRGAARALMSSLFARFPGAAWAVPAYVPEELAAEFFAATGWRRSSLTQVEMEIRF